MDDRVMLGLGEEAVIREPDDAERETHHLDPGVLVVEVRHADRDPDILPASGLVLAARTYGLSLAGS